MTDIKNRRGISLAKVKLLLLAGFIAFVGCIPQIKEAAMTPAPKIRVLLNQITETDSLVFNSTYEMKSEEASYEFGKNNRRVYIEPGESGFQIYNENRIFKLNKYDVVIFSGKEDNAIFTFDGRRYTGDIILTLLPGPGLSVVNRLNLETYLSGVVPAEMPSRNEAYLDALKAQAICARTYSMTQMDNRKNQPFDVYGDVRDQAYGGVDAETPLAAEAVKQTRGDILMYKDKKATVFYHSTSGGVLESSQNVWPNINEPYLQSRQDALGNEFTSSISPYFRWSDTLSIGQLDKVFERKFNRSPLKKVTEDTAEVTFQAKVLERTSSGRVAKMQIEYGDTTFTLSGYEIRNFFPGPNGRNLPSTLFSIKNISDSLMVINGGGYGHGVGMCQYGAMNMSQKGFKYYDILVNKYFMGTYLKKVY
jgi:stage II sporulation protein D